jgi:hypothetical protein
MKAVLSLFAFLVLVGTAGAVGSLVSSFYSPATDPMGLAWQSYGTGYVWVACHSNHRIYQCTTNGSVVRNFASLHGGFTYGLAAGQIGATWYIWSLGYNPGLIRRFTTSGTQVGSFAVYANPPAGYPFGLAYKNSSTLYESNWNANRIFTMHPTTGSVYSGYIVPSAAPRDLAYDWRGGDHLWVVDRPATGRRIVKKVNTSGSTVASFDVAGYGDPGGCCFDGTYVWIGFVSPVNRVLRFTAGETAVAPASLGRVKALFK